MLLYHPYADARHCVFRLLRLLDQVGQREIELQRLRVWDFYLLFPEALMGVSLPRGNQALKNQIAAHRNRYDVMPDTKRAFARLEPMQHTAIRHLAAKQLIEPAHLRKGKILRSSTPLPEELVALIRFRNAESKALLVFLTTTFFSLDLYGDRGVRDRTDLFDNRYDL